jgi:hypothetical protein
MDGTFLVACGRQLIQVGTSRMKLLLSSISRGHVSADSVPERETSLRLLHV